jgi:outer membrane autotransporter protein
MKTSSSLLHFSPCLVLLCALAVSSHALLAVEYQWTPDGTQSGTGGGNGEWNQTDAVWWDGTEAVAKGGSADLFGTATEDAVVNFYGSGTIAKEGTALFAASANSTNMRTHTLRFWNGSDYTLLGGEDDSGSITSSGANAYFDFDIKTGARLTMGGNGRMIMIIGAATNTAGNGIHFRGGGEVLLKSGAMLRLVSANPRLMISENTRLNFEAGSLFTGGNGSFTNPASIHSRIWVQEGIIDVNGGVLFAGYRAGSNFAATAGYGIALGCGVTSGNGGVLNINSGTVVALGDPRGSGGTYTYDGISIGAANTHRGGELNLNGGILITSNIRISGSAGVVRLNGGVVMVSTDESPGAAAGAGATDAQLQGRLNVFITGGVTAADGARRVEIGPGGAIVDTSLIDTEKTNGTAVIQSTLHDGGGGGGLEKRGANTLHLDLRATYTGTTLVSGGTLKARLNNTFQTSTAVVVSSSGVLDLSGTDGVYTNQILQNISGDGLILIGSAVLTAANSTDTLFGGTIAGATAATGTVYKSGAGALTLTASRGYGSLTVGAGTLIGHAASLQGAITNNAALVFDQTAAAAHSGVIGGTGSLEKRGAGELTLGSASAYTGATLITEGVLKAGADTLFASSTAVSIGASGTFDLNHTAQTAANLSGAGAVALGGGTLTARNTVDTVFAGAIGGAGTLVKDGAGRLTLTGGNTYADGTRIDTGTLAGDTGALQGAINIAAPAAALVFEQTADGVYAGVLSGAGVLTKNGDGALTLSGNSTGFAGATTLNAGALLLSGAGAGLGGVTTVRSGALLGGAGTLAALTLEAGGIVQIGTDSLSAQTLAVTGAFDVTSGTLRFDLFGGGTSDALNVGSFASAGSTIIDITTFESGTYFLGENLGALSTSGTLAIKGVLVSDGMRQSGSLLNEGGKLKLVTTAGGSVNLVWSGTTGSLWSTTSDDWDGVADGRFADRDHVTFNDGGALTITVDSAGVIVAEMIVEGSGTHRFDGGAITGDGGLVYGGATLTGTSGRLIKNGTGKLVLANGANDFKGGVELGGGVLALAAATTLGGGTIAITGDDTTIEALGDFSLGNTLALGGHGTTVDAPAGVTATLSGTITGDGVLVKNGGGALVLSASNAHAGTRLAAGTLVVGDAAALGGTLTAGGAGAVVRIDAGDLAIATAVDLGAAGATFDTQAGAVTLSGAINGAGTLAKDGGGTLALTADNAAFTGTLAIDAGAVRVNSAAALGGAALVGAGVLDIAATGEFTFASTAAAGGFTGTASVSSGSLSLDTAALDTLAGATLALASADGHATVNATGTIAALEMDGGALRIAMNDSTPVNMLTVGLLTVFSGRIAVDVPVPDGATGIANPPVPPAPGLFDLDISTGAKLLSATHVAPGSVGSTLNLTRLDGTPINSPIYADVNQDGRLAARATYNYNATAGADGIYLTFGIVELDLQPGQSLLLDNAGAAKSGLSARLTGGGGIDVRASGVITLNNTDNNFTGATAINRGTLRVVSENALATSGAFTIADGAAFDAGGKNQLINNLSGAGGINMGAGSLIINSEADAVFSGNIQAAVSSTLTKTGAGALTLGGASTHGDTVVEAGKLRVRQIAALGAGELSLADDASLELDGVRDYAELYKNIRATGAAGGTLDIKNSRMILSGSNALAAVSVSGSSYVIAGHANAFGGRTAAVKVGDAASVEIGTGNVYADNVIVDGGTILFSDASSKLVSRRRVVFSNNATVGISSFLPTGVYRFVSATDGVTGALGRDFGYAPLQHESNLTVRKEGTELVFYVLNNAATPAKDAAMTFDTILASMSAVYSRMSEAFLLPLSDYKPGSPENGFWARGFGSTAKYDATGELSGFDEWTYGIMTGYDKVIGDRLLLGGWMGMADSRIDTTSNGRTDGAQQLAGLYSSLKLGRFYISADVMGGMLQSDIRRIGQGEMVYGDYKGDYVTASAEIGFVLTHWETGFLKPAWSLHHMDASFKDHQESGLGAVRVADFSQERVQSFLRLQAAQQFTLPWGWASVADFTAGWRQTVRGRNCAVDMSFVSDPAVVIPVKAGGYASGGAVVGIGLRSVVTKKLMLSLGYDYETATGRQRHSFNGTLRYVW